MRGRAGMTFLTAKARAGLGAVALAALGLSACNMPPPGAPGPAMPIVHLGLMPVESTACLGPVQASSNAPILRDARLAATGGTAKLTGCILNPGPLAYRAIMVEITFFDSEGHVLSSVTHDATMLPPYSASPAAQSGAPRWLIPIDVEADPNAVQAEVVVHALVCPGSSPRGCTEEHDTAVVNVSIAKS